MMREQRSKGRLAKLGQGGSGWKRYGRGGMRIEES